MPKKPAKPIIHRSRFPAVNIPNLPIHKFILRVCTWDWDCLHLAIFLLLCCDLLSALINFGIYADINLL